MTSDLFNKMVTKLADIRVPFAASFPGDGLFLLSITDSIDNAQLRQAVELGFNLQQPSGTLMYYGTGGNESE